MRTEKFPVVETSGSEGEQAPRTSAAPEPQAKAADVEPVEKVDPRLVPTWRSNEG